MKNVQNFCRNFRINILKLSLQDLEDNSSINHKTISAFENHRSTNINHLAIYLKACSTIEQKRKFIKGLNKSMLIDMGESNNDSIHDCNND